MEYSFDKAYNLRLSSVYYDTTTDFSINEKSKSYSMDQHVVTPANESISRHTRIHNRKMSFWYVASLKSQDALFDSIYTVNAEDITVAGMQIDKKTGLITDIDVKYGLVSNTGGNLLYAYKVSVSIEVMLEKSVLYSEIPIRGTFFVHPKTKEKVPVQFSVNYKDLVNKYSSEGAVHICGGYGFYSMDRQDLNVREPVLLTKEGSILEEGKDAVFMKIPERHVSSWKALRLPKECGVEELCL